jgi:hypothetical protein
MIERNSTAALRRQRGCVMSSVGPNNQHGRRCMIGYVTLYVATNVLTKPA